LIGSRWREESANFSGDALNLDQLVGGIMQWLLRFTEQMIIYFGPSALLEPEGGDQ
jgi:hypothetical protein